MHEEACFLDENYHVYAKLFESPDDRTILMPSSLTVFIFNFILHQIKSLFSSKQKFIQLQIKDLEKEINF